MEYLFSWICLSNISTLCYKMYGFLLNMLLWSLCLSAFFAIQCWPEWKTFILCVNKRASTILLMSTWQILKCIRCLFAEVKVFALKFSSLNLFGETCKHNGIQFKLEKCSVVRHNQCIHTYMRNTHEHNHTHTSLRVSVSVSMCIPYNFDSAKQ